MTAGTKMGFIRIGLRVLMLTASGVLFAVAHALNGQFGLEWSIDAPWRLEPSTGPDGQPRYGSIPIVITFADMNFEVSRGVVQRSAYKRIFVGKLVGLRVREYAEDAPTVVAAEILIPVAQFQEIERKKDMSTPDLEPSHEVCRPKYGQDCSALLDMTAAHEFHATAWYRPQLPVTPGRNILLEVTAITERKSSLLDYAGGVSDTRQRAFDQPLSALPESPAAPLTVTLEWKNYVAVHAGDAPLPRFASDWLYGDFHYHSQGTDNENETGYAYRNVVRALGAAGLDFVFATDHASAGEQQFSKGEARDLNVHRFASGKSTLYGPDGANQAIAREAAPESFARVTRDKVMPQIYMGEEIDVVPEMQIWERTDLGIQYGDKLLYRWSEIGACHPDFVPTQYAPKPTPEKCREAFSRPNPQRATHFVYDLQGLPKMAEQFPARQHMVYFPTSSSLGAEGFIASDTGPYGGARKPIVNMLREVERGGYAFLAHPMSSAKPGDPISPDIVPYSDLELTDAWKSAAVLGLQFWNENTRMSSEAPDDEAVKITTEVTDNVITKYVFDSRWTFLGHRTNAPKWSWQKFNQQSGTAQQLYQGAVTWDRFLRRGLDRQLKSGISWLRPDEPRRWFMGGGSDSHGDLNYRRASSPGCGFMQLGRFCDKAVNDTAIGNPRNLVSMRGRWTPGMGPMSDGTVPDAARPRAYANRQVLDALKTGNFSVTDGPAIRVVVDQNRNGKIEDSDFPMGSVVDFYPGEYIPILVEWWTTPEFGPIDQVDLYVGNKQVTFAAEDHGPIIVADYEGGNPKLGAYKKDPSGALQVRLADDNDRFNLRNVDAKVRYHGVAQVYVAPGQFQLAENDGELFYVRAFAKTISAYKDWFNERNCKYSAEAGNKCGDRYAFANPVWGRYHKTCPNKPARPQHAETIFGAKPVAFLDSNANRYPDICESVVLNPCEKHPETGGPDATAPLATAPPEGAGNPGRPGPLGGVAVGPGTVTEFATAEALSATKSTPTVSCQKLVAL